MGRLWPLYSPYLSAHKFGANLSGIVCTYVYFSRWRPLPSWISKKGHFGPLITLVLPVSISMPNLVQIDQELAEIHLYVFSKMTSAIKLLFLTPDDTYIAYICQLIQFGANWSRIGRYMPFCVFSKMAAAAILIFCKKWHFGPLTTLVLTVSISTPKFVQIDPELAEIHPFVYFPRWRPPPSWICYSSILDHPRCPSCWVVCYLPVA